MKKLTLAYIFLFIIIAVIVFAVFIKNGISFIWRDDGLRQHYIILKDFNDKIRNFISSPNNGLELFSWSMGLGLDVIGQYSYYIIGDPFAYISLLFPMENLEVAYTFLVLLRIFCIGFSFMIYAKYHNHSNRNILLGAIIYAFCSFTLYAGVRHPYFLNAMILFPMLLLGVDKLFKENKKVFLCVWVAISAICSYYFFYMHTIMLIIYAIIKYIFEYRKYGAKFFFKKLLSGIVAYVIGIFIASIVLFPTVYAFLNSARSTGEVIYKYGILYYEGLFTVNLLNCYGQNWSFIGIASIILLIIPIFWSRRKQNKTYFVYWIVLTIFLLIPLLGSMMNGFSFPNNRWSFIYSFVLAYMVTLSFDFNLNKKELRNIIIFLGIYTLCAIIAILSINASARCITFLIQIIIAIIMFCIINYEHNKKENKINNLIEKIKFNNGTIMIFALTIVSIGITAYGLYTKYDRNYAKEFIKFGKVEESLATQIGKNKSYENNIKSILENDKTFFRIAKTVHSIYNLPIYYDYPSTEVFLSIGNRYIYELSKQIKDERFPSFMEGWADRTKITTLLGTKYYMTDEKSESKVPYGYFLKENLNGVKTYENKFPLSLGISYDEFMLKKDYEKLTPLQREDAILKVAVIESEEDIKGLDLKKKEDLQDIIASSYKEGQALEKNKIVTTNKNESIKLTIPEITNSELYVYITGFEFNKDIEHTVTAKFKEKVVNKTIWNKLTSAYYQPSPELLFPLGYYEKAEGEIELSFSISGIYNFDTVEVLAVPMASYEKTVKKLQENELKEVKYNSKEISGKINLKEDSILQISTGYTIGWKAYIDGEKKETIKVNTAFIGIPIEKGEHEIVLKYEVPYLNLGICFSIVGVILLVILTVIEKTSKSNKIKEEIKTKKK